jgi:hypothetical protein
MDQASPLHEAHIGSAVDRFVVAILLMLVGAIVKRSGPVCSGADFSTDNIFQYADALGNRCALSISSVR